MRLEARHFSEKIYEVDIAPSDMLNGAEIFIGRAQDCHIVLDDHQVSRHHASLALKEGKLWVRKLSSHGSLTANGAEVQEVLLGEGGKFSIVDYSFSIAGLPQENIAEPESVEEEPAPLNDEISEEATAILNSVEEPPSEEVDDEYNDDFDESDVAGEESEELSDGGLESEEQDEVGEDAEEEAFASEESFEEGGGFEDEGGFENEDGFGADDDGGFGGDDGFGDDSAEESTKVFQSFASYYLEIDGEKAPFDKYKIEDNEIYIGRDPEKCQIALADSEVSTVHAVIKKTLVNCFVEDLNSSNGTIFNGARVNKAELTNNDNFQIGSTIFTVKVVSDLLESEKDILMPVEDGQVVEIEEIVEEEVDYDELTPDGGEYTMEEVQEKSIIKRIWKNPKQRRIVLYGGVAVLLLWVLEQGGEGSKTPEAAAKGKAEQTREAEGDAAANPEAEKKVLSPDVLARLEENYALALAKYEAGEYYEAREYLEVIRGIDPNYKDTQTLHGLVRQGHEELLRLKAQEEAEKERQKRQIKIQSLLVKTREAVKEREVAVAENLFNQILEMDPENMDVPQLRLELDAYKEEQRKKKEEEARKKALRQSMVEALQPGKTLFLKEDWYKAIIQLEKFTGKKGMDEDLIKEATTMLMEARKKLSAEINPLLGRARSFKEGQDLKRSYETYGRVLEYDPSNEEALNERAEIHETLRTRSMKVYREGLIAESLSLFDEAREKFEEVQQVSPVNSEYYNKATQRLKDYLE